MAGIGTKDREKGRGIAHIERACARLAADRRSWDRERRRRLATRYRRHVPTLLFWTFPESRDAVTAAAARPEQPAATRALCRRLWRDLGTARALPRFYRRREPRIEALRDLYTAECHLYSQQRARAGAQAAMNGFILGLAAE